MEETRINHSVWKTLPFAVGCLAVFALFISGTLADDLQLSDYPLGVLLFFFFIIFPFLLGGLYFLLVLFKERLLHQPFMTITGNSIIVRRLLRKKVINFCDVRCFVISNIDNSRLSFCYRTESQQLSMESHSIGILFIDTNAHELLGLLNKLIKMSKQSSQSPNSRQRNKPHKLFMAYDQSGQTQKKSSKEVQETPNYNPVFRVFFVSVIMTAIYAFILWGKLEWGFPRSKSFILEMAPLVVFFAIMFICRKFIVAIRANVLIGLGLGAAFLFLTMFLVAITTELVKKVAIDITEIPTITPEIGPTLANSDYVHVANLTTVDLDTIRGNYHFTVESGGRFSVSYVLYGAYPLRSIPNVYLVRKKRELQDEWGIKKDELERMRQRFVEEETGFMLKIDLSHRNLTRLRPSDIAKGYLEAIKEICQKENKPFDSDNIVVYEIYSKNPSKRGVTFCVFACLITLLIEFLLLIIVYERFFDYKKYERAVNRSPKKKTIKFLRKPDRVVLCSLLALMAVLYLLMVFFNMDASDTEMLMQWGALERVSVFEKHEWWRLLTYGFLHSNDIHLIVNVCLFVGCAFFSSDSHSGYRIILVFLLSSFVCGLFFLLFGSGYCCVGSSGGLFGIMGFLLAYDLYLRCANKDRVTLEKVMYTLVMIVFNIQFNFDYGISMSAHISGLVAGIILGVIMGAKDCTKRPQKGVKSKSP